MENIDKLVHELIMTSNIEEKGRIAEKIRKLAWERKTFLASIYSLYAARGRGECEGFTVPAINLRSLTYELARAFFRVNKKLKASAAVLEIARSEMGYTDQSPVEYAAVCLAAAVKEGCAGPVFVQGDHFQINAKKYTKEPEKQINDLKKLIAESINAGFLNIDIDSSTLVDLSKSEIIDQQKLNYEICGQMTQFIRSVQPKGVTVSVGGEIGEVGKENSKPEELEAFMSGYNKKIAQSNIKEGLAKISVQTGTSHGGVVLPDGTVAKVKLDFDTLKTLSEISRSAFKMAGAVQHGASTLPEEAFHKFAQVECAEVHLATQFQNMIFESRAFPADLKAKIYEWVKAECASERKPDQTDEQFIYSTRKKALGPFKKEITALSEKVKQSIGQAIEEKFDFLFTQLNASKTKELVDKYIKPVEVAFNKEGSFQQVKQFEGDD